MSEILECYHSKTYFLQSSSFPLEDILLRIRHTPPFLTQQTRYLSVIKAGVKSFEIISIFLSENKEAVYCYHRAA